MTIGISIDDLLKIDPWQYDNQQDVLNAILDKCTELSPWLPIDENTPKDRPILLLVGKFAIEGYWGTQSKCWFTYDRNIPAPQPTHFCQLPADPK